MHGPHTWCPALYLHVCGRHSLARKWTPSPYLLPSCVRSLRFADTDELHLPAEASQRKACVVSANEQSKVVLATPSNAIRVRYSVPDGVLGGGTRVAMRMTIMEPAGCPPVTTTLMLTSKHSYYYGAYPFVNNPLAGKGHHFYDEVYLKLNATYAAGTVLTFQHAPNATNAAGPPSPAPPSPSPAPSPPPPPPPPSACTTSASKRQDCGYSGINESICVVTRGCCWVPVPGTNPTHIPYCFHPGGSPGPNPGPTPPAPEPPITFGPITLDVLLAYLVPPPVTMPAGGVSLVDMGGDPTGTNDSAPAFGRAMAAAIAKKATLWIPAGRYEMSEQLTLPDHLDVRGPGAWYAELHWPDQPSIGLIGKRSPGSMDVQLRDFAIRGEITHRCDSCPAQGLGGALAGGSVVQGMIIQHTKVGMWMEGPFDGLLLAGNIISDTAADGINLHGGVSNVTIVDCHLRNLGDDGIAQWADKKAAVPDADNVVQFNTVELPILANNIALCKALPAPLRATCF